MRRLHATPNCRPFGGGGERWLEIIRQTAVKDVLVCLAAAFVLGRPARAAELNGRRCRFPAGRLALL